MLPIDTKCLHIQFQYLIEAHLAQINNLISRLTKQPIYKIPNFQ